MLPLHSGWEEPLQHICQRYRKAILLTLEWKCLEGPLGERGALQEHTDPISLHVRHLIPDLSYVE